MSTNFSCCSQIATGGFHGNSPFCLGEDEEVEIEVQEDFLSFSADLVAEQLTYMDAVRGPVLNLQKHLMTFAIRYKTL